MCERVLILRAGRKVIDARLDELQRDTRLVITLDRDERVVRRCWSAVDGAGTVSSRCARWPLPLRREGRRDVAPVSARQCIHAGFALYGLSREQRTLETVFAEVNVGGRRRARRDAGKTLKIAGRELMGYSPHPRRFCSGRLPGRAPFIFFWVATFFERNLADVRPLFQWMPLLLIFLVAALTMRAWAEERRAGTLELLLTSPTAPTELVLGKFLGCLGLVLFALVLTLALPITVSLGPLDWGPVIGGYAVRPLHWRPPMSRSASGSRAAPTTRSSA